jgi:hypothetical protein
MSYWRLTCFYVVCYASTGWVAGPSHPLFSGTGGATVGEFPTAVDSLQNAALLATAAFYQPTAFVQQGNAMTQVIFQIIGEIPRQTLR